jgi:hypothetical protein
MAVTNFYTVTIELAHAGASVAYADANLASHQEDLWWTSHIRIAEAGTAPQRQFILHGRGQPAYGLPPHPTNEWTEPLSAEESDHLYQLLSRMTVAFSPLGRMGFDGSWHTLNIVSGHSNMHFRWWVEVPEGWESVGAVFDYAMELAERTYLISAGA